jgi:hypothetical protein
MSINVDISYGIEIPSKLPLYIRDKSWNFKFVDVSNFFPFHSARLVVRHDSNCLPRASCYIIYYDVSHIRRWDVRFLLYILLSGRVYDVFTVIGTYTCRCANDQYTCNARVIALLRHCRLFVLYGGRYTCRLPTRARVRFLTLSSAD